MLPHIIEAVNDFLYSNFLILLLLSTGIFFTVKSRGVQFRLFPEAFRVVSERQGSGSVSAFSALMISTASRVGTGNIVGVSAAICLGGSGAVFWLFATAAIGAAAAFVESTLAQIYKRPSPSGGCHGGPAYYIEAVSGRKWPAVGFCILLMVTHGVGFNMLSAYNLQSAFSGYAFYRDDISPWIIGGVLAFMCLYCLLGGGKRIAGVSQILVPIMVLLYSAAAAVVIIRGIPMLPDILKEIIRSAFDLKAMLAGISTSALMYGLRRGLFSNEAGMGTSPNAAAAVDTSHPVKQGLVQMLSVFIDTMMCIATAFICLCSHVTPDSSLAGIPYVNAAVTEHFGSIGRILITISMFLFAFTSLIGNFFYIDNCILCICGHEPGEKTKSVFRLIGCAVIFAGCGMSMETVWGVADLTMAFMCLINLPAMLKLNGLCFLCLKDYEKQRAAGREPVFRAENIGLQGTSYWQ